MNKPITGRRRSAFEIVRQILSVCDHGDVNKTAIMYRSNLSYEQLQRYLALLSAQGLIKKDNTGHFDLTPRGHQTLEQVSDVILTLSGLPADLGPIDSAAVPSLDNTDIEPSVAAGASTGAGD